MAESFVQVAADGPGKQIDTFTSGAAASHRQVTVLGDSVTTAAVATVGNITPASTDYGLTVRTAGTNIVSGPAATGAAVSGNPVLMAGSDGTNARTLLTDATGKLSVIALATGAAANGTAVSGNPVLSAGSDGTSARTLLTDATGKLSVVALATGSAANGAAVAGNPVLMAGSDGTSARTLSTDATGKLAVNISAAPAITKGTQGASGFTVQDLKDAGRNIVSLFMAIPVITTATDALVALTGYKSGAAVAPTTTPAVVTTAKTLRINNITIQYVAVATAGSVQFTLRANPAGVVAITSPAVMSWNVGTGSAVAGVATTVVIDLPDGIEFAAGTGIGLSMIGYGATSVAAAVGYGKATVSAYEY